MLITFDFFNMKTIEKILSKENVTKEQLDKLRKLGLVNWMWWKWWIQFTNLIRKIDFIDSEKLNNLLDDLDYISDIHDLEFNTWWWIFDFLNANYKLVNNILILINWTSLKSKIFIWFTIFTLINIFWIRFFKWTNFF